MTRTLVKFYRSWTGKHLVQISRSHAIWWSEGQCKRPSCFNVRCLTSLEGKFSVFSRVYCSCKRCSSKSKITKLPIPLVVRRFSPFPISASRSSFLLFHPWDVLIIVSTSFKTRVASSMLSPASTSKLWHANDSSKFREIIFTHLTGIIDMPFNCSTLLWFTFKIFWVSRVLRNVCSPTQGAQD